MLPIKYSFIYFINKKYKKLVKNFLYESWTDF